MGGKGDMKEVNGRERRKGKGRRGGGGKRRDGREGQALAPSDEILDTPLSSKNDPAGQGRFYVGAV